MPAYLRGLDADIDLTPYAGRIKSYGFDHVGRYTKNVTRPEIDALHAAGLGVWLIFEATAMRALSGAPAGTIDGALAVKQLAALGAPEGLTVFATVDTDPPASQLGIIRAYMTEFSLALQGAGGHHLGIYACGTVLRGNEDIAVPWLAGAMGWSGSRDYDAANRWAMKQGPDLGGRAGAWGAVQWPAMGFDYDPNLIDATKIDGIWASQKTQFPPLVNPMQPPPVMSGDVPTARDRMVACVKALQTELAAQGYNPGPIDGDAGPRTIAALQAWR